MATKKGTTAKKGGTKAKHSKPNKKPTTALILFAVSLFVLAITFIPGENFWNDLKNFFFGLFGVLTYIFPFYLLAISVFYAMDKLNGLTLVRFVETAVLIFLVQGAIDIFVSNPAASETYTQHLAAVYQSGSALKSGGFIGGLIGWPLSSFGKAGAIATVFLLIFVFLMLITGTTVVTLVRKMQSSAKTVKDSYKDFRETVEEQKKARREEIDIPLDEPKTTSITAGMTEKQRQVISTYRDIDIPPEETESTTVEEAITAAEEEAVEETKPQKALPLTNEEIVATETEIIEMEQERKEETYQYPPLDLLKGSVSKSPAAERAELENTAQRLVDTLRSFGVDTTIVDISRGPTVTRYELQPSSGVKISKITNLADDIALNLATAGVRIEAPIPNKAAVGIEVPNKASNVVHIREILESSSFTGSKSKLTIALGKDIAGNAIVGDVAKMPHGLIAGATGSGKSVCINSIIMSILYKATPEEVKLLMIDPKVVELGVYNGIPHLLVPVVTDPRKAAGALGWAVTEMEQRYAMFAQNGVRDLAGYNKLVDNNPDLELTKMPQIVIIIDELADLMMTAPSEVEDSINRIAAKARAAGMHLLIATQRPSVDVVTGVIKANIPSRIAFAVSSQVDSRTILDMAGAEKLLGRGDMLFNPVGCSKPNRLQGCFVSDEEVEAVVDYIKGDHSCEYDEDVMQEIERQAAVEKKNKTSAGEASLDDDDPMLNAAIETVVELGQASTSMLQRKLKLGYARAARLIDIMEERGVVGPYEGSKPRQVLMTKEMLLEKQAGEE